MRSNKPLQNRQTDKTVIPLVSFVSWSLKRWWSVRDTLFRVLTDWWRILYFDVTAVLMLWTAAFSWSYVTRPFMYLWQHKWSWRNFNKLQANFSKHLKDAESKQKPHNNCCLGHLTLISQSWHACSKTQWTPFLFTAYIGYVCIIRILWKLHFRFKALSLHTSGFKHLPKVSYQHWNVRRRLNHLTAHA